ncbi:uncharacterized protein BJ171DRAFT_597078 [Polychytrium aggregatum]|uniref:uncharacterized protein n=1 Tax=Polychytrium aggregatum TaxID=110093 RepID=UPI0022FF0831|nr:uncharacterized protein BJ171DRAFT_597078 [Polychytrium aggregatum]KAI9206952.1 hypothetical protein BJ171DRAFT_597078 [Polychytrium aggregatum]
MSSLSRAEFEEQTATFLQRARQHQETWMWVSTAPLPAGSERTIDARTGYLAKQTMVISRLDGVPKPAACSDSELPADLEDLNEGDLDEGDPAQRDPADAPGAILATVDLHVVYLPSWGCPVLFFNAYDASGQVLDWAALRTLTRNQTPATISQQEHPLLHIPFYYIHPCNTAEFMRERLENGCPVGDAYMLIWLGAMTSLVVPGLVPRAMFETAAGPRAIEHDAEVSKQP